MNRAVCLQRPEPSEEDLQLTGKRIIGDFGGGPPSGAAARLAQWLRPLAEAYHEVYTAQKGRDFVGMRDYYQLPVTRNPRKQPALALAMALALAPAHSRGHTE